MPDLSVDAKRKIAKLKKAYLDSFPDKIRQLQALWKSLEINKYSQASMSELAVFCHKLAGSSGSYELLEVSQAANLVEIYCNNHFSKLEENEACVIELNSRYLELVKVLEKYTKSMFE